MIMKISQLLRHMPRQDANLIRQLVLDHDEKTAKIRQQFRAKHRTGAHLRFSSQYCDRYESLFPENKLIAELALRTTRFLISQNGDGDISIQTTMMTSGVRPLRLDPFRKRGDWVDSDSLEVASALLEMFNLTINDIVRSDYTEPYIFDLARLNAYNQLKETTV